MAEEAITQRNTHHRVRGNLAFRSKKFSYAAFFVGPALLVLIAVLIVPTVYAVYLSLHDFAKQDLVYVGFENYSEIIAQEEVWNALWINVKYTALTVLISLIMGFLLAILMDKIGRGKRLLRTVFTLPWPILSVVAGIIFAWMFNAQYGVINEILVQLGVQDTYRSFLGEPKSAMAIVILASVWKESPFFMIMIYAAMQAIPREQYEAAAVDGADARQQFLHITLPNLRQMIMIATMLQIIWRFRDFDIVSVMTQGGPNKATEVLSILVYQYAFKYFRFGEGAAIAIVMTIIILIFTILYLRILRDRQETA